MMTPEFKHDIDPNHAAETATRQLSGPDEGKTDHTKRLNS
jgi:hypothetical protein